MEDISMPTELSYCNIAVPILRSLNFPSIQIMPGGEQTWSRNKGPLGLGGFSGDWRLWALRPGRSRGHSPCPPATTGPLSLALAPALDAPTPGPCKSMALTWALVNTCSCKAHMLTHRHTHTQMPGETCVTHFHAKTF